MIKLDKYIATIVICLPLLHVSIVKGASEDLTENTAKPAVSVNEVRLTEEFSLEPFKLEFLELLREEQVFDLFIKAKARPSNLTDAWERGQLDSVIRAWFAQCLREAQLAGPETFLRFWINAGKKRERFLLHKLEDMRPSWEELELIEPDEDLSKYIAALKRPQTPTVEAHG